METSKSLEADVKQRQLRRMNGMVWSYKTGQMIALLIHIADRLNIFKTLAFDFEHSFVTRHQVAQRLGLHPRWVMEILRGLTAAKILEYKEGTDDSECFRLSEVAGEVVANEADSLLFAAGAFSGDFDMKRSDAIVKAFKTGLGYTYESTNLRNGEQGAAQTKRMLGVWTRMALVSQVIAALNNGRVTTALKNGGAILDLGCGAGVAVNELASSFPAATVHGLDPDSVSLSIARKDAREAKHSNTEFFQAFGESFEPPNNIKYDCVMCLDIIHDAPRPDLILLNIMKILRPGGTLLIKDIRSTGSFAKNLESMNNLGLLYGFSISSCLSSSMSQADGLGLGTLGFNPVVAKQMAESAGFQQFKINDFKDPANLYYEMISPAGPAAAGEKQYGISTEHDHASASDTEKVCIPDLSTLPGPMTCSCHAGMILCAETSMDSLSSKM